MANIAGAFAGGSSRPAKRKYYAFISYSHVDKKWGEWLQESLEKYKLPRRFVGIETRAGKVPERVNPVFRDTTELPTASNLTAAIKDALLNSGALIVICSPDAAKLHWVNEEVLEFKKLGRAERIICLMVRGEPNVKDKPFEADQECFTESLRFKCGSDGHLTTEREEPVAADVRLGGSSKRYALLKIVSRVVDINFGDLVNRDITRRRKTIAWWSGMSLCMTAIIVWLVISNGLNLGRLQNLQSAVVRERNSPFPRMSGAYSSDEREVLRTKVEIAQTSFDSVDARHKAGAQQGTNVNLASAGLNLHMAEAELAWANGELDDALAKLEQAVVDGTFLVQGRQLEWEIGAAFFTAVQEAEDKLATAKLAHVRMKQFVKPKGDDDAVQR